MSPVCPCAVTAAGELYIRGKHLYACPCTLNSFETLEWHRAAFCSVSYNTCLHTCQLGCVSVGGICSRGPWFLCTHDCTHRAGEECEGHEYEGVKDIGGRPEHCCSWSSTALASRLPDRITPPHEPGRVAVRYRARRFPCRRRRRIGSVCRFPCHIAISPLGAKAPERLDAPMVEVCDQLKHFVGLGYSGILCVLLPCCCYQTPNVLN